MGRKTQPPTPNTPKSCVWRRLLAFLKLATITGLLVTCINAQSFAMLTGSSSFLTKAPHYTKDIINSPPTSLLPSPQPHPLPPTLAQWQDSKNSGDYFSQVAPMEVGYLIWSQFPVKVYIETSKSIDAKQAQAWINEVSQAVQEWNAYLPLKTVEKPEVADIKILRKAPPLQISPGSKIPRARSAQTTYEIYSKSNILYHKFTILLSPSQTGKYLLAAARHELGHALGIWGHSPLKSDVLYFSQVRNPLPISSRDVNTLKRIYEQPTSLGWNLPEKPLN